MEIMLGLLIFSVTLSSGVLFYLLHRIIKLRMQIECLSFSLQGLEGFVAVDKATVENLVNQVDSLTKDMTSIVESLSEPFPPTDSCSGACSSKKKPTKSRKAKKGE